ncbi:MAG: hypothetical protein V3W44_01285 [Dehalococcoidales bacterium]
MGARSHANTDYKGRRFNRLVARSHDPLNRKNGTYWWFMCDCGAYKSMRVSNVVTGKTKSCGCLRDDYLLIAKQNAAAAPVLRHALQLASDIIYSGRVPTAAEKKEIEEALDGQSCDGTVQ